MKILATLYRRLYSLRETGLRYPPVPVGLQSSLQQTPQSTVQRSQALRTVLILFFSIASVVVVTWFAPSLSAASLNMLFRLRGTFNAPADLIILAIDDQ